ncbi:MAG: TcpQ domain-containing protein [Rhizorhabdus sp.]|uniref:TcpQ domain-containing protein n=1 Tax=Rhizorhabdus sp. TaxID=1968843 RepID=UPI001B4E6A6D|nr:TcpQ domain-containing protein [Rhizorhabdus sp.]MBP8231102.1 TcpQ domain-containing protein [Rhizorhabdus sp.]
MTIPKRRQRAWRDLGVLVLAALALFAQMGCTRSLNDMTAQLGMSPAPATSAPPVPDVLPSPQEEKPETDELWHAKAGDWLVTVVARWARDAGWPRPINDSDWDWPIETGATFQGSLQQALTHLARGILAKPAPEINIYTWNRSIVITSSDGRKRTSGGQQSPNSARASP